MPLEKCEGQASAATERIDVIVGRSLRRLRERSLATASEVANVLNLPVESYLDFEAGRARVGPKYIVALAQLFRVQVKDLFVVDRGHFGASGGGGNIEMTAEATQMIALFETLDAIGRRQCIEFAGLLIEAQSNLK